MTDNNSDKRGHTRISTKQRIAAFSVEDASLLGQLANFHDKGFMLISNRPIHQNGMYRVRMEFAKPVAGREHVQMDAECLWTRATTGNQVWAGFSITNIAAEDQYLLAELATQLDG